MSAVEIHGSERATLTHALQMHIAGHRTEAGIAALCDVLALVVGFASSDIETAECLVDALVPDIKAAISRNWDEIAQTRATSVNARGHA